MRRDLTVSRQAYPQCPFPRLITGRSPVIKRAGEGVKPLEHLRPVDMCHAQPLGAAPQLAAVLGGDDDAVGHHTDFNLHPVGKSRLFRVVMQKQPRSGPGGTGRHSVASGRCGWYNAGEVTL